MILDFHCPGKALFFGQWRFIMGDKLTTGDISDSAGIGIGRNVSVNVGERPTSRDYLVAIWEYEQKAAGVRNLMIIAQVSTAISIVALIIVLWVVGVSFAGYVNTQFSAIDDRFETIERRLDTIDRRIQRIATPEPYFNDMP